MNRPNVTCNYCGKFGHDEKKCFPKKNNERDGITSQNSKKRKVEFKGNDNISDNDNYKDYIYVNCLNVEFEIKKEEKKDGM